MFSKKDNDLLIVSGDEEARAFYRVELSREKPVGVSIGLNRYQIRDIGDGGIGVYRTEDKDLEVGQEYSFEMTLPLINEEISGLVRVVDISDQAYQCEFVDIRKEETEKIHLFVLELQEEERRTFSRVQLPSKEPINVSIGPKTYQIKDIGAGGIAFYRRGDKELEVRKEYPFKMALPLVNKEISGIARVVDISDQAYRCVFVDLGREEAEKIHLFIFAMQKEETGAFFRVEPSSQEPIDVSIVADRYQMKDIGAGGIALYRRSGEKGLELGKEYPFKMILPLINEVISGVIRIVHISDITCHCAFVDLGKEDREKIHAFVLERQKEELRRSGNRQ